jgi:transcriptional regulator with XRE-family HTH domain
MTTTIPKSPNRTRAATDREIDIARRIRAMRLQAGMTQTQLAEHLGVSFQQLQKYESGGNRISPGKIEECARVFGQPIGFFYGGELTGTSEEPDIITMGQTRRGTVMSQAFMKLSVAQQEAIRDLCVALAKAAV